MGKITSPGIFVDSLQWINVSSKSKIIVFLKVIDGRLIFFSSYDYVIYFIC